MTPFDLRPGVRVLQARFPEGLVQRCGDPAHLWRTLGRTGTVELVTDQKTALVRWDDGTRDAWTADFLDLVT